MRRLLILPILLAACAGGKSGDNTVPLTVGYPAQTTSVNIPTISIQICPPGGAGNCQTVDDISIDTGSIGLRVLSSAIDPALLAALPTTSDASGDGIAECYVYADGFVFGSIRTTDLTMGHEEVKSLPFQVIGDLTNVPEDCASAGANESDVTTFGSNGIIGVGLFNIDCGGDCADGSSQNPLYYTCSNGACTAGTATLDQQVPNPVARLDKDNNGVVIDLPSISDAGAVKPVGSLIFGIDTQSNNKVGGATVYLATGQGPASVSASFNDNDYDFAFFDTGSTDLSFASDLPICEGTPYYCPVSTESLKATITGSDGTSGSVDFKVSRADVLFMNAKATAFDDLADNGQAFGQQAVFDWGLPFFFGRKVFCAMEGASTASGTGPFYAF